MIAAASIFFDINLPNATTWFYFSALLAVALFFKFNRWLSIRNGDVLALFLPMPGFLLLHPGGPAPYWGYLWLLASSGWLLARCLFDLTLVRRPALGSNLNLGGLAWLAGTLFVSLIAVAVRHPNEPSEHRESSPASLEPVRKGAEELIPKLAPAEIDRHSLQEALTVGVERGLTVLCHLSIAVALLLIGWRHFEDPHGGMAMATFYLLLPYTYLLMPRTALGVGRWHHAWPMALMVWTVFSFRRPTLAGIFLGLAAGTVFFPLLVFPLWLSFYRRRGARRFAVAFVVSAVVCLSAAGLVLWLQGALPRAPLFGWKLSAWLGQPSPDLRGLWQGSPSHWAYRLPIFLVYAAFVGTTAFWPSPKDLAHVIALSAAVLLGIQFWYADQGGVYILWYLPLLLLMIFRPNLSACQPRPPGDDWLARFGRWWLRIGRRWVIRLNPVRAARPVSPRG
ncbi:MAG: hypothetical protein ACRELF_15400 [Gemmataceae bacterium]